MGTFAKFLKKFKQIDIYGHEIKLLFKGNETKSTLVGAFLTITTIVFITLYLAYQLKDINDNKREIKELSLDVDTQRTVKTVQ